MFSLKKLGRPKYFLGVEVSCHAQGSVLLSQSKYIKDLLTRADMLDANGPPTPMLSNLKLSKHDFDTFLDPH